jgi:murein L,D-transpeptidase YcbB/YkuD
MKTFFKSQRAGTISRRSFLKNGMPGSGTVYNFGPDFMHADMGRVRQRQAWHMCSSFGLLVLLLLGSLILAGGSLHAQDDPVAAMIRQRVEKIPIKTGLKVGACRLASPSILPRLYQDRGYRPIWTKPEAVNQLITAIQESYLEGLNPQDYSLAEIRSSTGSASPSTNPFQAADRDLLLTTAFLRLAANFFCGKEDPVTQHPEWNILFTMGGADPLTPIEMELTSQSILQAIDSWKVHHPYYQRLKQALATYRAIRAKGGWEPIPGGGVLKIGMSGPEVAALRRRLAAEDLELSPATDQQSFDAGLQEALRRFQGRYSLKTDGMVGSGTLAALNVPVNDRIDQIRVNLERCRWVLKDLDDTFVLVNIAGFRVAYLKHNQIVWSSKVQVGRPYRDTPVFRSQITYLELNPTWTVPPTILAKDIIPAVKKNPAYLGKKNLKVIDQEGRVINPSAVNWSKYPQQPFPYMLRQDPGTSNSLGLIKIIFPNQYNVYLHDTPHRELFEQEERTFSSGCIRVEHPLELAELLLDNPTRWGIENLRSAVAKGKTQRISLPRPVPVLLMYMTVTVDKNGVVFFKSDPYKRDPALLQGIGRDADIRYATSE